MQIIKPEVLVPEGQLTPNLLTKLERYARVCYKSEDNIIPGANDSFLRRTINKGHESVIEHEKVTVMFIVDRGISHEIVRHRIASYSQESTRYCNYGKGRFGKELTFIQPFFLLGKVAYTHWEEACLQAEKSYLSMLDHDCTPQEARSVLPNSLKTEMVVTYNMREWRHFFKLRCAAEAHPQMRQVAIPLLRYFSNKIPVLFEQINYDTSFTEQHYAVVRETNELFEY